MGDDFAGRSVGDDKDMSAAEVTNALPALAEFWHPVALSCDLGEEPVPVRLAGQGWALARIGGGLVAFPDACPRRRARLSAGSVSDGTLQCMYHGWRFAADGRCVDIPALGDAAQIPARAALLRAAEVTEHDGLVWLAPLPPRAALPELAPGGALEGEGVATVRLPGLGGEAHRRAVGRQLPRRAAPAVRARGHDRRRGPGNHSAGGRGTPWPVVHCGSRAHVHQPHRPGRPRRVPARGPAAAE